MDKKLDDRDIPPEELGKELSDAASGSDLDYTDEGAGRFGTAVNFAAEIIGLTILIIQSALVFFNATARYVANFTFIWADELVLLLFPWLGMIGMFLAIRRRQIIRIDFFASVFPTRVWQAMSVVASLFAAAVFVYLAMISFDYVKLFGADRSIYLHLQKGWFTSAMVIGSLLAAVAYVVIAVKDFRTLRAGKLKEKGM